jgi:hypothetical protein
MILLLLIDSLLPYALALRWSYTVVEPFVSLRRVPIGVYEKVGWTQYIPLILLPGWCPKGGRDRRSTLGAEPYME